jgi:hypothetical protein
MSGLLKRNSVLSLALAALFGWMFMFAKHDPALGGIIAFGEDPYDAVGSFAIVVALLVAVLAGVRAFRPYRTPPSAHQQVHLVRAQAAVTLSVFITMARHPSMWIHASSRTELMALLGSVALVAIVVHLLILGASPVAPPEDRPSRWKRAATVIVAAAGVVAFYPEQLVVGVWTHLVTVVVGALILFAPMRPLLIALVPDSVVEAQRQTTMPRRRFGSAGAWLIVTLLGVALGVFAFLGELSEGGGGQPIVRLLFVAAVFLGLSIAGLLIAFAFLGAPLGLS